MSAPDARVGVAIASSDSEFEAILPAAENKWAIVVALLLGVPWLVGLTVVSVALLVRVEPEFFWRAVLGLCLVFFLTILITVLAVASIWYAFYTVRGTERLHIDLERVLVVRRAMGIDVPVKAPRGFADKVVLIDEPARASGPSHNLEVHAGRARTRMGAGVNQAAAEEIQRRAQEFLDATRDEAVRLGAGLEPEPEADEGPPEE
jgi:hypothetical protein